jgi:gliding motility-associated-like protein
MKYFYQQPYLLATSYVFRVLITGLAVLLFNSTQAQCPPNIDFELGDFSGWQCYIQNGYTGGTPNPTASPATPGRHDIMAANPGNGIDPYGQFPRNCPNSSGYSVRIGHTSTGGQMVDKIAYTFTIPAGQNTFTLMYNYALVLNDGGGGHNQVTQPRFIIQSSDITNGTALPCQLDEINVATNLPGFFQSAMTAPNGSIVKCRNWAAGSLNLDGYAGHTIQIAFTVTGCGLSGGTHFGYAYIDVNTECGSAFSGATFCPDDAAVTVTAPVGYQTYNWYNGLGNTYLGSGQSLTLNPPPLSGDSVRVELVPFNGYGCLDTLTAYLWDTLTVRADAGADKVICDNTAVQLGGPPQPNRVYKWTPVTGLSNPDISDPMASPSVTTQYTLTVTTSGGGCATPDVVNVAVAALSDAIELIGSANYCKGSGQSAILKLTPLDADSIQWYQDNIAIPGAIGHQQQITITQTGAYYAKLFSFAGCERTTAIQQINIYEQPTAGFTSNTATQCALGNQFVFTNTSTIASGALQYAWDFGDGNTAGIADVNHNYTKAGNYTVKMVVTGPGGCTDTKTMSATVNPSPTASFAVDVPQQCFKNNWFVFSNSSTVSDGAMAYTWDFGDASFDNAKDVGHHYTLPGTYLVKLNARETAGGCADDSVFSIIVHESPVSAFTIDNNVQCFPGHQFVLTNNTTIPSDPLSYTWYLGDGVNQAVKDLTYSYTKAGDYTITMIASTGFGCKDTTVHGVIVHPTPAADFSVRGVCENLAVPVINRTYNNTTSTINYLWDFGNGHLDNMKTPAYSYPAAGTYPLSLTVSTVECPVSFHTKTVDVTIDAVTPGVVYPDKDAAFNFPEPLSARPIGNSVTWTPATSLNNRFSYTPKFTGIAPQLYTITLRTATGCVTVDTQLVKTHKKIEIYVPTGFTVNGDGKNDYLRPVLIGFTKVNYFRIYNRWGKLLFTMNNDYPGWDGKINNKPAETQTVVWMIEAVDIDGVVHNRQGTTVLFR